MFKKKQNRAFPAAILAALALSGVNMLCGCSNNDVIKEDPAKTASRVEAATKMRSFFDKSNGNYDSLSAADKSALDALTGGEKHSREAFGHMAGPTGH